MILLKPLSLSTICEEAYSEPRQAFGMDVSARVIGLTCRFILAVGSIWDVWGFLNLLIYTCTNILFLLVDVNWF